MATTFPASFPIHYSQNVGRVPRFCAMPFAFQHAHRKPVLQILGCLVLAIGLYVSLLWLLAVPLSGQLVGRWQMQTVTRNAVPVPLSGEYEFRSDYTSRQLTGVSGTRAGLWIIRAPLEPVTALSRTMAQSATVVTATYQFVDTLTNHINVHVHDQQGEPNGRLWPGPGIYEITIINDQLILRTPDREAGGWIVIECTKAPPLQGLPSAPDRRGNTQDRQIGYKSARQRD